MKIAIVSGGTGGHIYPGLAIAEELKRQKPAVSILFLGSAEGLENKLVTREGYAIKIIRSRALLRKLSYQAISAPFVSALGFFQAIWILKKYSPDYLISTGGYASLPVVLAAKILAIKIILHEQNVFPGFVNRFVRKFADKVFVTFSETRAFMDGEVVGNPVRRKIREAERENARRKLGISPDKRVVLVLGGSQGSKKINETVIKILENLPPDLVLMHIIGKRDFPWVFSAIENKKIKNYHPLAYLHDMDAALAAADLVVSRAGATAIAEFLVRGLPMVLIPFPYAADDHQRLNAEAISKNGGAVLVPESEFNPEKLFALLTGADLNYARMKQANLKLARPDAAERIVDYIYHG